jgi:hypothetical protein
MNNERRRRHAAAFVVLRQGLGRGAHSTAKYHDHDLPTTVTMLVRHRLPAPFSPLLQLTTAAAHKNEHHAQQRCVIQFP